MFIAGEKLQKTPQGNLLLNQLEIEWKSILLAEQFSVLLRLIPLQPSSVEVIIVFDVIGCDEVEKVV